MSNVIVPNVGKVLLAKVVSGESVKVPDQLLLFVNNAQVGATTVIGDLTEATFPGYARGAMANPVTDPTVDSESRTVTEWDELTFTASGASTEDVYGYAVLDDVGALLWAEKFDLFIPMRVASALLKITPILRNASRFSNA